MTRHSTIIAGRGTRRRAVRVERKRGPWAAAEIRHAGVSAVGDALFRMGGALSGRDVLRILAERRASDPVGKVDMGPERPVAISVPGLLAADVARHIHPARGRFGMELWLGGML